METAEAPRGGTARGLPILELGGASAAFVSLFLPWFGFEGHTEAGWIFPLSSTYGVLALAVALVELLSLVRAWSGQSFELVVFCLVAGAGLMGVSAVASLRWDGVFGFGAFQYGAWLGLAAALVLIALGALRLAVLRRSAR